MRAIVLLHFQPARGLNAPLFLFYSYAMDHAVIETDLGAMGIGWTERGVARVSLPGGNLADRLSRWGYRETPPPKVAEAVELIIRYASGEPVEFDTIELDFGVVPEFHRAAYNDIRNLKWGQTTTYGAIARRLGDGNLSRAVGQAMGANPMPLIVPCHRVLGADGKTGGFSGPGGVSTKMRMLELEQAAAPGGQLAFGF
jgi:methylated-DNA-[protein]-cysteine S-methyltransferase